MNDQLILYFIAIFVTSLHFRPWKNPLYHPHKISGPAGLPTGDALLRHLPAARICSCQLVWRLQLRPSPGPPAPTFVAAPSVPVSSPPNASAPADLAPAVGQSEMGWTKTELTEIVSAWQISVLRPQTDVDRSSSGSKLSVGGGVEFFEN